jgi:NADH:ubiquinone oxidoreductase subunit C
MMDISEAFTQAEQILSPWAGAVLHPAPERMDVTLPDKWLKAAVNALKEAKWGYLSAITGLDHPGTVEPVPEEQRWQRLAHEGEVGTGDETREGTLEVLYHFCQGAAILTLRVTVRYSFPVLPSICNILPAATLYERELIEMFGIRLVGTPNVDKLLLPDGWPDGVFPMRKSFHGLTAEEIEGMEVNK